MRAFMQGGQQFCRLRVRIKVNHFPQVMHTKLPFLLKYKILVVKPTNKMKTGPCGSKPSSALTCHLLGFYAACSGNSLQAFLDEPSIPVFRVRKSKG
jgi:hypothetical protein